MTDVADPEYLIMDVMREHKASMAALVRAKHQGLSIVPAGKSHEYLVIDSAQLGKKENGGLGLGLFIFLLKRTDTPSDAGGTT